MTPQRLTPDLVRRAESAVGRIQGVSSCRIRVDGAGSVQEIHVTARSGKAARLVARDVETVLKAELDIDVDHRKIGVVSVDPGEPGEPGEADTDASLAEFPILEHASRFAFIRVNVVTSREGTRAEVELARDAAETFGSSSTDNPVATPHLVIAEATLRAVSELLDDSTRLCLGGALKVPLGDCDAVIVRVDVVGQRNARSLAGCALVGGNENQSVVFATLDAVNRLIGKLEFKSSIEYKIK